MLSVLRAELLRRHRLSQMLRDVDLAGLLLLCLEVRLLLADHLQVGQVAISGEQAGCLALLLAQRVRLGLLLPTRTKLLLLLVVLLLGCLLA